MANKHRESGSREHLLTCETTESYPVNDLSLHNKMSLDREVHSQDRLTGS